MTLTTYKWILDRYHQAVNAGIFDDQPVELLNGELVVASPEGLPHTYYSDRFSKILQKRLGDRAQVREGRPITKDLQLIVFHNPTSTGFQSEFTLTQGTPSAEAFQIYR